MTPALAAAGDSSGLIDSVTDEEIISAYKLVASTEGTFCEPASAASFAGLVKMHRQGLNLAGQTVVCVITGTGLKDPDLAVSSVAARTMEIEPTVEAVETVALAAAK